MLLIIILLLVLLFYKNICRYITKESKDTITSEMGGK